MLNWAKIEGGGLTRPVFFGSKSFISRVFLGSWKNHPDLVPKQAMQEPHWSEKKSTGQAEEKGRGRQDHNNNNGKPL